MKLSKKEIDMLSSAVRGTNDLKDKIKSMETELAELRTEKEMLMHESNSLRSQKLEYASEVEQLKDLVKARDEQLIAYAAKLESVEEQLDRERDTVEDLKVASADNRREMKILLQQCRELQDAHEEVGDAYISLKGQLHALEEEREHASQLLRESEEEVARLARENRNFRHEIGHTHHRMKQLRSATDKLEKEYQEKEARLEEQLETLVLESKEEAAAMRAMEEAGDKAKSEAAENKGRCEALQARADEDRKIIQDYQHRLRRTEDALNNCSAALLKTQNSEQSAQEELKTEKEQAQQLRKKINALMGAKCAFYFLFLFLN